jgi:hypothetical protein
MGRRSGQSGWDGHLPSIGACFPAPKCPLLAGETVAVNRLTWQRGYRVRPLVGPPNSFGRLQVVIQTELTKRRLSLLDPGGR